MGNYNYTGEIVKKDTILFILPALNLSPTAILSTWRYVPTQDSDGNGAQIDLLFDRNVRVVQGIDGIRFYDYKTDRIITVAMKQENKHD